MAMTLAEYGLLMEDSNRPYMTRWQEWFDDLSPEQRAEYLTGNDLGAKALPPEPYRSYREALLGSLLRDSYEMMKLPFCSMSTDGLAEYDESS